MLVAHMDILAKVFPDFITFDHHVNLEHDIMVGRNKIRLRLNQSSQLLVVRDDSVVEFGNETNSNPIAGIDVSVISNKDSPEIYVTW